MVTRLLSKLAADPGGNKLDLNCTDCYILCCVAAYQAIERSLEELGERWASVCRWVEEQWLRLEDVDIKWKSYHSLANSFNRWLDDKEVTVGRMVLSDMADPHVLVNQIQKLKVGLTTCVGVVNCVHSHMTTVLLISLIFFPFLQFSKCFCYLLMLVNHFFPRHKEVICQLISN